jgi:hypothetical protein
LFCLALVQIFACIYVYIYLPEQVPTSVYLNALSNEMPECNRKTDMSLLSDGKHAEMCYVYCAQRSCHAAEEFMKEHESQLRAKCSMITYLQDGAFEMNADDLVDGALCHKNIKQYNDSKKACLTCEENHKSPITVTVDGTPTQAHLVTTSGEVPEWYQERGILASLPSQFSCDKRYHPPQPHQRSNASSTFEVDISRTDLSSDAILGYWASRTSNEVLTASDAYGDFENSGIVQCEEAKCILRLDFPGRYTASGNTYTPHIHFTEWKGDRWNRVAKTIEL